MKHNSSLHLTPKWYIYRPMNYFQYNLEAYLTFDNFHPSGEGYQAIAEELYRILDGPAKIK